MDTLRRTLIGGAAATAIVAPAAALAQRRGGGRASAAAGKEGPPLAIDDGERKALEVLDDIDKRQRYLNVTREDGRLLRVLAQSIQARSIVEIGTSTGYSAIWLALALRSTGGRLTTYEIDRERAAAAAENLRRAGLGDLAQVVVGDAHVEVTRVAGPLDLVFIDADKDGYLDYLQKLLPKLRPGGLIVADNMQVPQPDPRYVRAVTTDPGLETLFINMHATGLGVTLKKA